jgi:hypothetical protein
MHIATNEDLSNLNALNLQTSAALLHEYVHYLQDLTTTYGLMNISYVVDFIKTVNYNQRRSNTREMQIPYQLSFEKDNTVFYNSALQQIYRGNTEKIDSADISHFQEIPTTISLPIKEGGTHDFTILVIRLFGRNKYNTSFHYDFGSHSILESMAYEIEKYIYPTALADPSTLPYQSARIISEFIYPYFSDQPLNLIALCDWALMDFHPAAQFVAALKFMWQQNFYPESPKEIYEYLRTHLTTSRAFLGYENYMDLFTYLSVSCAGQLSSYFTTERLSKNKAWTDYLFANGLIIRKNSENFFQQLCEGGPIQSNQVFLYLLRALGQPPTTNLLNNAIFRINSIFDHDKLVPEALWAMNQIYNIFINSAKSKLLRCNMIDWCRRSCLVQNIPDYTDHRCTDSPWLRVNDQPPCAFSEVWKGWGLEHEIPTPAH